VVSFGIAFAAAGYFVFRLYGWVFDHGIPAVHAPRRLLAFSIPAVLAGTMPRLIAWIDRMFVGVLRPESETGIYQAVSQSSVIFSVILAAIGGGIVGPMMARFHGESKHARLRELFRVTTKWGLYAALPVFLLMSLMPSTLLQVVYGAEYVDGAVPLMLLAWAGLLNAGTGSVGLLLVMTGHERAWFVITSATFALDVTLQWTLIPALGLSGAALGTAVATGLMFAAGIGAAAVRLRLWPYDRRYLKGLAAALVTGAALGVVAMTPAISETMRLALACAVALGVFPLVLLWAGLEQEDRELIAVLWSRVRRFDSGAA
jgi:O-antigen/teichoic acid export membrane protein